MFLYFWSKVLDIHFIVGRANSDSWISVFEISFSMNDIDWTYVTEDIGNAVQFQVNYLFVS